MHTPTLTIVEKSRVRASTLQQKVCAILNWTDEHYATCVYNAGLSYLVYYTSNDDELIAKMERSKLFWNWFKNCWAIRNEVFVSDVERMNVVNGFDTARRVNEALYIGLNCPFELSKEIKPDAVLLNEIKASNYE